MAKEIPAGSGVTKMSGDDLFFTETDGGVVLLDLDSMTFSFMEGTPEELAGSVLEQHETIEKSRADSYEE